MPREKTPLALGSARSKNIDRATREQLLAKINALAERAVFGTPSETFRTCGNPGCRCHHGGPKHGPHLYVSFRSDGKTKGFYVPQAAAPAIRSGIEAWHELLEDLAALAAINRADILDSVKKA